MGLALVRVDCVDQEIRDEILPNLRNRMSVMDMRVTHHTEKDFKNSMMRRIFKRNSGSLIKFPDSPTSENEQSQIDDRFLISGSSCPIGTRLAGGWCVPTS